MSTLSPTRLRRLKRVEYERRVECGIFSSDDHIELIDGLLVVKEPQSADHYAAIRRVRRVLEQVFGAGWQVDPGAPIALDDDSEPEPDVSVIRSAADDYASGHPTDPVLVVEISRARLAFDRGRKNSLYARAHVPEYWIVNLVDRVLEVHREPRRYRPARYGWRYTDVQILGTDQSVSPLAAPRAHVAVAALLPPDRG